MDRDHYFVVLRQKMEDWENDLELLQDEVDRADDDVKDEYMTLLSDLYRDYEDMEVRVDELEEMSDEDFEDDKDVIDEQVEQFENDMREAKEKIEDV